jgi:hypothetical protein
MTNEILDTLWAGMRDKTKLLILENEHFAVIVDNEDRVYWETSDAHEEKGGHTDTQAWNDFLNRSAYVEITPCSHLDESTRLDFKRLIAEATARALDNDFSNAEKMLVEADKFVSKRNQETSRFWYLSASGVVAAFLLIVGAICWLCRFNIIPFTGFIAFFAIISAVAGALGALLSIILRMGKAHLDCSSGQQLHYLEASSRIIAGSISGVVMYLAIKAGVVGEAIFDAPNSLSGQLLLAIIAGASERWMPSIISKFENDIKG